MQKSKILKCLETKYELINRNFLAKKNNEIFIEYGDFICSRIEHICASDLFQAFIDIEMFKSNNKGENKFKLMQLYRCGYQTINTLSSIYSIKNLKNIISDYDISMIQYCLDLKYENIFFILFDKKYAKEIIKIGKETNGLNKRRV